MLECVDVNVQIYCVSVSGSALLLASYRRGGGVMPLIVCRVALTRYARNEDTHARKEDFLAC